MPFSPLRLNFLVWYVACGTVIAFRPPCWRSCKKRTRSRSVTNEAWIIVAGLHSVGFATTRRRRSRLRRRPPCRWRRRKPAPDPFGCRTRTRRANTTCGCAGRRSTRSASSSPGTGRRPRQERDDGQERDEEARHDASYHEAGSGRERNGSARGGRRLGGGRFGIFDPPREREHGVDIRVGVIVRPDDGALLLERDAAMPPVAGEVVGAGGGGVRRVVQADAAVTVSIDAVLQIARRQELRIAEGARARALDGEGIDPHAARDLERGPDLGVERAVQVARACPHPRLRVGVAVGGTALEVAFQILRLLGHGEAGEPVEDHAAAGVAAAVRLDRDDGGAHARRNAEPALGVLERSRPLGATVSRQLRSALQQEVAVHGVRLALPRWRELEAVERRHARIVERALDQVAGDAVGYEPRL